MANDILLSVLTPDRKVFEDGVDEVVLPGGEGYLGVLPGHAPLLTSLKIGELSWRKEGRWRYGFLAWGFAEVLGDKVRVLADVGELAGEIDPERATAARDRAQKRLGEAARGLDVLRARTALERALARLSVAGHK
ncbi:MAG TPA: F0F1 ATP synthase subunit epsilon [Candidatus Saccharimonadales bacterium]|nr:F0F1 ATP synthase subunit epsilon [Candidatus Saccharimonadales bacterium]